MLCSFENQIKQHLKTFMQLESQKKFMINCENKPPEPITLNTFFTMTKSESMFFTNAFIYSQRFFLSYSADLALLKCATLLNNFNNR